MTDQTTSIDETLLPRIRIDDWARPNSWSFTADPSAYIRAALISLNSNAGIHSMLVQINHLLGTLPNPANPDLLGVTLKITADDLDYPPNSEIPDGGDLKTARGGYVPTTGSYSTGVRYGDDAIHHSGEIAVASGNALVYLESRQSSTGNGIENSFLGLAADGYGSDFTMGFQRTLFHELVHVLTTAPNIDGQPFRLVSTFDDNGTPVKTDDKIVDYREDVAIIAENFLYVPHAQTTGLTDPYFRLGHTNSASSGGSSGMQAFSAFTLGRSIMPAASAPSVNGSAPVATPIEFNATKNGPGSAVTSLTLAYHEVGFEVGSGAAKQSYDHYLTFEMTKTGATAGLYVLGGTTVGLDPSIRDVLSDSLVQPSEGLIPYDGLLMPANQALHGLHSVAPHANKTSVLSIFQDAFLTDVRPEHLTGLDRMVTLSAERFTDVAAGNQTIDITGPVQSGTKIGASILAIDESEATTGTLIFGGSGYTKRYDFQNSQIEQAHGSFSASSDLISGSDHGDVIILGTGGGGTSNVAFGGAGHDILTGRTGNDALHGGAGNDILIGGYGNNLIDGGGGFDIVSYADAAAGVAVNLSDTVFPSYGANVAARHGQDLTSNPSQVRNDDFQMIEGVIGSDHADMFIGRGGSLLIGGEGDDVFYLKSGDVAFGGGGHDTFYLMDNGGQLVDGIVSEPARYAILDLNAEDSMTAWSGWPQSPITLWHNVFDEGTSDQPGRLSLTNVYGYFGGPYENRVTHEIFVDDLQEGDWSNLPFGPGNSTAPYIGPAYDFHSIFDLSPLI